MFGINKIGMFSNSQTSTADEYTKLLLHFDGSFADSSSSPHTVTAYGNAVTSTSQKVFGTASAYFDGTDDYIETADSDDWAFNGDFTIDFRVRFLSTTGRIALITHGGYGVTSTNAPGWSLIHYFDNNYISFTARTGSGTSDQISFEPSWTPSTNTWYHLAVVRSSGTLKIYIDGTALPGSASSTHTISSTYSLRVGICNSDDNSGDLYGFIDELRISKGIARWTGNFTPPTAQY